jgi:restriction system protein
MAKKQTAVKNCPPFTYFYGPTLKALDELGGSGSNEEIYNRVLLITQLPTDIVDIMHNFTMTEVEYRLAWARTYLKNFGAIENSKHRVWSLTAKGAKMLKDNNIDAKEISVFTTKKRGNTGGASEDDLVKIESTNWREQITDILLHLDPYAFERLAQRLLRECGFSDVQVTKRSGDGGIDERENSVYKAYSVSMSLFNASDIKDK